MANFSWLGVPRRGVRSVPSQDEGRNEAQPNEQPSERRHRLPSWLDHFNVHDLKVLFRCWVAAWVASLLMFIGPSLRAIGAVTFFACMVLILVPPSGIVFIFILAALTLLMGMGLAWGWGVIVMKAAVATRSQSEIQTKMQALKQQATSQASMSGRSVATVEQELIYSGFMLDTRETAVYFALICLFIYFMARLRASNPKFTLLQIFATIVSDLFLTVGPLYPSFQGILPKILIEPAAIGVGLGLAASVLFFPESTTHTVLRTVEQVADILRKLLNFSALSVSRDKESLDLKSLEEIKAKIISAYRETEPAIAFLPLDFSMGPWSADDVKALKEPLRGALLASLSLLELHILQARAATRVNRLQGNLGQEEKKADTNHNKEKRHSFERRVSTETTDIVHALQRPESGALRPETVDALRTSSMEILAACQSVLSITADCIHTVNSTAWLHQKSEERFHQLVRPCETLLTTLAASRASFATDTVEHLLETYGETSAKSGKPTAVDHLTGHSLRGIMLAIDFEERVLKMADTLLKLLTQIVALLHGRTASRIWFPTGLRYAMAWVFRTSVAVPIPGQSPVADPNVTNKLSKEIQRQLHVSHGYRAKQRHGIGKIILRIYHWFISVEGMYALRMVVVTIALAIPAVIPTSAGFYYREKCIWGLIIGQTTLLVYMADVLFSIVSGLIGTVVGGVLGLVAWYIGSGGGEGNPYGLAAIIAFALVIIMWGRLFFSPVILQAVIISGTTCLLVVGYSFDETHLSLYSDPGKGYSVFLRRLLLVIIGFISAIIVQMFPRPPSASRHICKSLSNIISSLSDRYALLLSHWSQTSSTSSALEIQLIAEKMSLALAEELSSLSGPITFLHFEFSSSPFNSATVKRVRSLCQDINQGLGYLLSVIPSLPPELQGLLAQRTGMLDQRNINEIMAVLSVVKQALKTDDPLPEALPTPLIKRCHEHWMETNAEGNKDMRTEDLIRDRNHGKFLVAVSSYLKFVEAVDGLELALKDVLGEAHVIHQNPQSMVAQGSSQDV